MESISSTTAFCGLSSAIIGDQFSADVVPLASGTSSSLCVEDVDTWKSLNFPTVNDAYTFYCNYAHSIGFSVRIGSQSQRTNPNNGLKYVKYMYYTCNKEGFKENSLNDPSYGKDVETSLVSNRKKQRVVREERSGCFAKINFKYVPENGWYVISHWEDVHNHELYPPELVHHLRSNRRISKLYEHLIEANKDAGLSDKSTYELICQAAGGIQSAGFLKIDMKNFIRGKRTRDMSAGDLSILLQFLSRESQTKPNFFYDIQLDEDALITNIFWSDGMMRHDYSCFGDVVSFDTTFRTNKEYFPLAAFIGFTHHRQTCIFGAALLHDQSSDTFEWLLDVFLKCMDGKRPISIFTDRDAAMKKAISLVLPECFHGICSWHLCENAASNLGSLANSDFNTQFNFLISQVDDEDEFEYNWKVMIDELFGGIPHPWLETIYPSRKQWSSAWVRSTFSAGLKSTQISESFNAFIRHYASVTYSLPQFFHNFNIMLDHMREKLNKSISDSLKYLPSVRFIHSSIVNQAAQHYTPPIFNLFQDQYSLISEYFINIDEQSSSAMKKICHIFKEDSSNPSIRLDERLVEIDLEKVEWICSCRKFINWGFLCVHILKAIAILGSLGYPNMRSLPEKYLLKRWSKNARGEVGAWTLPTNDGSSTSSYAIRHQSFCSSMIRVSSRICIDDQVYCFFIEGVNELLKRVDERPKYSLQIGPASIQSTSAGIKKGNNPIKSKKRLKSQREINNQMLKASRSKSKKAVEEAVKEA